MHAVQNILKFHSPLSIVIREYRYTCTGRIVSTGTGNTWPCSKQSNVLLHETSFLNLKTGTKKLIDRGIAFRGFNNDLRLYCERSTL